ncbi:PREDICTED: uncharacterized protein LOC108973038 [Bactrocera latifrons]|uniref:uncharacterized protein LOC108973038 n=1 Tax=Bactrocera latifrons TaxID=174628 RepID=UPI0008DC7512|nr:PREDICTED: uncharacterized protein LOC108973038 [Bactrocera latifrons]
MSPPTSFQVKEIPDCRQSANTTTTTAKTTSKPFVANRVLHFFCDFFKLASLVTGFFGIWIIYFNKQFWKNKHITLCSICAITSYCLVFVASVAAFIQIKRIEILDIHLLKLAYENRQKNKISQSHKRASMKRGKTKTKYCPNNQ